MKSEQTGSSEIFYSHLICQSGITSQQYNPLVLRGQETKNHSLKKNTWRSTPCGHLPSLGRKRRMHRSRSKLDLSLFLRSGTRLYCKAISYIARACIMLFIPETRGCLIKIRDKYAARGRFSKRYIIQVPTPTHRSPTPARIKARFYFQLITLFVYRVGERTRYHRKIVNYFRWFVAKVQEIGSKLQ